MKFTSLMLLTFVSATVFAGSREQALKLHNRITGVPPQKNVLDQMTNYIETGRPEEAARLATQSRYFYDVVLKNWIKPWSNRDQTSRVPLNDYVATVIGIIRDDKPFDTVLYDDVLYTVNGVADAYARNNNTHYTTAENNQVNLLTSLSEKRQSDFIGFQATSGILTTRAAGEAFYSMGTNRRVNRFTFMNYLCKDYEDLHDTTVPDFHVRRDVERNPGGDSRTYKNRCVGCHAGQDALGGAFAFYDFNMTSGQLEYTPGVVARKINNIVYHKEGWETKDDSWVNLWAMGQNAALGWSKDVPTQGKGVRPLGMMFARSRAFSECMAKKVFELVCIKKMETAEDKAFVKEMADEFMKDDYNMKNMIINTSVGCVIHEK